MFSITREIVVALAKLLSNADTASCAHFQTEEGDDIKEIILFYYFRTLTLTNVNLILANSQRLQYFWSLQLSAVYNVVWIYSRKFAYWEYSDLWPQKWLNYFVILWSYN